MERSYVFPPPEIAVAPVAGDDRLYPVGRIFCVGRNYPAHAVEMGMSPTRDQAFYFTKPSGALVLGGADIPYPPGTGEYHYEMELVVAIGADAFRVDVEEAWSRVFGYACGLDMTRRDLQQAARATGRPWDLGKAFEHSAVIGPIATAGSTGRMTAGRIRLSVNDVVRQEADLSDLIWSVPEIIADLSQYYHLRPGDLIYTGTPAGVGAVGPGDRLSGSIDRLADITCSITEPD